MRRTWLLALLLAATSFAAEGEHGGGHAEPSILWKWANFALLAGVLGYLASKNAGAFFASRNSEIQSGLHEAKKLKAESDARVAEVERRVANLQQEMEKMRQEAKAEMTAEAERQRTETANLVAKIQTQGEHEIAAATKVAQQQLRAYSAELAVELAAQQIREQLTPQTQDRLVQGFVKDLDTMRKAKN